MLFQPAFAGRARLGADHAISPCQIGALPRARTALRPAAVDFVQLATSSAQLELTMEQVRLEPQSELPGCSVLDAGLRRRFGVIVVAIQRADGHVDFNPSSDATTHAGDHLVVLGPPDHLWQLESLAGLDRTTDRAAPVFSRSQEAL